MSFIRKNWIIILFLLVGFFIRVYNLSGVPLGFHDDEVDAGYIGRYILIHGEDIKGNPWPIYYDKLVVEMIMRKDSTQAYRLMTFKNQ